MSTWKTNRLRQLRFDKRMSQHEIAARLNISQSQYWKFENAYAEPDDDTKKRIARVLKVPVDSLLTSPEAVAS